MFSFKASSLTFYAYNLFLQIHLLCFMLLFKMKKLVTIFESWVILFYIATSCFSNSVLITLCFIGNMLFCIGHYGPLRVRDYQPTAYLTSICLQIEVDDRSGSLGVTCCQEVEFPSRY